MRDASRTLGDDDLLLRVLAPDQHATGGPRIAGFEDRGTHRDGQPSHTLSFWCARFTTPRAVLGKLSMRASVRALCGMGRHPVTPEQMYQAGYRVAVLPASELLAACRRPSTPARVRADCDGNEISSEGHVEVYDGHRLAPTWASLAAILSQRETLSP